MWVPCNNTARTAEDLDAILHTKLILARNQFCPIRLVKRKSPSHLQNKWFGDELKQLRSKGRAIQRSWLKSHSRTDLIRWQKHQAHYKLSIKKAKKDFVQINIAAAKHSPKALFKLKSAFLTPPGTETSTISASTSFCQGLAQYFHDKVQLIRDNLDVAVSDPDLPKAQSLLLSWSTISPSAQSKAIHRISSPIPAIPKFTHFSSVTQLEVHKAILHLGSSSSILDPLPTPVMNLLLDDLLPDITILVNTSLAEGRVPEAWKKGVVTPLLKKAGLDPSDFKNYRPVTQLRFMARLVEYIVTSQIQAYLEYHHILHDNQSGFRPARGTEVAVANIRETLLRNVDRSHPSILLLLDLSAAFDTVDHAILSERLSEVAGITGTARSWIISFLSNRVQVIRCGETLSSEIPVPYGVPQGSSLSPVLFNLYTLPLAKLLDSIGLPFQCYADDTQIAVDLHQATDQITRLVPGLILIKDWMRLNKLKLNEEKTEILGFPKSHGAPLPPIPWPTTWGPHPPVSCHSKDLGIMINSNLDGSSQAKSMSGAAHYQLGLLLKLFPLLSFPQKISLYHAMVGSRLSYGIGSLLGASAKTIHQLQKVQNRAIRSIFSLPWREHISPWRAKLGWLSISSLITFRIGLWIWKALHHHGPKYTNSWLPSRKNPHPLRTAHCYDIPPLAIKKSRKGGRTIGHRGTTLWNALPNAIRSLPTVEKFKRALKEHLLSKESSLPEIPSRKTPNIEGGNLPDSSLGYARPSQTFSAAKNNYLTSPGMPNSQPPPGVSNSGPKFWGVSSPPLPRRNNQSLIECAARNKKRLIQTGYYLQV